MQQTAQQLRLLKTAVARTGRRNLRKSELRVRNVAFRCARLQQTLLLRGLSPVHFA
jgi:hypothetical protein